MIKACVNLCLALLAAGSFYGQQTVQGGLFTPDPTPIPDALPGSYAIVAQSYEWGSSVSKAVVHLDKPVKETHPEQFSVVEEKPDRSGALVDRTPRTVTAAYPSDQEGQPVKGASQYVSLELAVDPDTGLLLRYHADGERSLQADPYQLVIELAPGQTIQTTGGQYSALSISRLPTGRTLGVIDRFTTGQAHGLTYASYSPPEDKRAHPLVVWLHGLGEGGTDPLLPLLGNRSTLFAEEEFQTMANGAHVLVPQCPTFWLDDGDGQITKNGRSCYTDALMELIVDYVAAHPDIDTRQVYVGGCSNGGYMTLELVRSNPDFFAAAFPICPVYESRWLSDGQLDAFRDTPMWLVHCLQDNVVSIDKTSRPLSQRLTAQGCQVRFTALEQIVGLDGQRTYPPHYSWVPVLNDQIADLNGNTLFSWLLAQKR